MANPNKFNILFLLIFSQVICEAQDVKFGEFGVYDVDVVKNCTVNTAIEPVNGNLAILYCALILLAIGILFRLVKWAVQKRYTAKLERFFKLTKRQIGYEVHLFKENELK